MLAKSANIEEIFYQALKKEPLSEQTAYLDHACGDDVELRTEVESLLIAHAKAVGVFESPVASEVLDEEVAKPTEAPGTLIGRYKLLEFIGEGGFGDVYMAEQQEPVRRKVALKIIKLGMDTRAVIARFEAERQALALMDHPNIAKVLDAGATETGRPYFVMDLVRGWPITEYCDANNLTTEERFRLFDAVCQAVQHAHQKGIIHRDLKPRNVMVTLQDTKPVPKIIDFGVAKATQQRLTEKTLFTEHRQLVGTPEYMSPEQATFGEADVDTRSDIYSLGVLLYELLVGTTPFDAEALRSHGYDEICRVIRESDPPTPSKRLSTLGDAAVTDVSKHRHVEPAALCKFLRGDPDWIVMKCLEKDRRRRYETATGLAKDIECLLQHNPVEACPPTAAYRVRKFVRRNRIPVYAALVVLLVLVVGTIGTTIGFIRANYEAQRAGDALHTLTESVAQIERERKIADLARNRAEESNLLARRHLYAAHMKQALLSWDEGHVEHTLDLLARHKPKVGLEDMRSFDWYYLWQLCHSDAFTGRCGTVFCVAFSPDGTTLASPSGDKLVRLWDPVTGGIRAILSGHTQPVWSVAFSPDGKTLATGSGNHLQPGEIKLWEISTRQERVTLQGHRYGVQCIAFTPDGQTMATSGGPFFGDQGSGEIILWDVGTRKEKLKLEHEGFVRSLAFSPDGTTLASVPGRGFQGATLWDAASGQQLATFEHSGAVSSVAFSPEGTVLATGGYDVMGVRLWDVSARKKLVELETNVLCLAFSPDGQTLATAGGAPIIRLWDVVTGQQRATLKGHTRWIWSVAFSPDGKLLASGSRDGTVKVWRLADALDQHVFQGDTHVVDTVGRLAVRCTPVALSPDGQTLATTQTNTVRVWSVATGRELASLTGHTGSIRALAFSAEGTMLASVGDEAKLWNLATLRERVGLLKEIGPSSCVAFSPDGTTLAASSGNAVRLWGLVTGKLRMTTGDQMGDIMSIGFSPDGRMLATSTCEHRAYPSGIETVTRGEIKLWDTRTGQPQATFECTLNNYDVAFSPDGRLLAAGGSNEFLALSGGTAKVWNVTTGEVVSTLIRHKSAIHSLIFSPDGKLLVTAGPAGTVKLWDTTTWEERLSRQWEHEIDSVMISPDSRALFLAGDNQVTHLRAATDEEIVRRSANEQSRIERRKLEEMHFKGMDP